MSSTTSNLTKAQTLAQLQALVSGLQTLGSQSFTLVNTAFTASALASALQGTAGSLTALNAAQAGAKAALVAWNAEQAKMAPFILALKQTLVAMYSSAPDKLAVFGLAPPRARAPRTGAQIAAAAAKAEATRKARGTGGKKQKAAITGNVTGIQVIPVMAPAAAPPSAQTLATTTTAPTVAK